MFAYQDIAHPSDGVF